MHLIEGRTADTVWRAAARTILRGGRGARQASRAGITRELLHCCLHVDDPQERWAISREPAINPAFALAEVVWIVMGRKDSAFLNFWNPKLRELIPSKLNPFPLFPVVHAAPFTAPSLPLPDASVAIAPAPSSNG